MEGFPFDAYEDENEHWDWLNDHISVPDVLHRPLNLGRERPTRVEAAERLAKAIGIRSDHMNRLRAEVLLAMLTPLATCIEHGYRWLSTESRSIAAAAIQDLTVNQASDLARFYGWGEHRFEIRFDRVWQQVNDELAEMMGARIEQMLKRWKERPASARRQAS